MFAAMSLDMAVALLPGLVLGLTVHEFAHAWSASLLGDDFARRQGRVSLNPLRHLSPLGTLAIIFLPIGWGRPVTVNLFNFRRPKLDYLLTSLAGPAANLLLAAVLFLAMLFTRRSFCFGQAGVTAMELAHAFLRTAVLINVLLAVCNLLPIPPLDGSKIWPCLIPGAKPGAGRRLNMVFLLVLVAIATSDLLDVVIEPPVRLVLSAMPRSDAYRAALLQYEADEAIESGDYARAETLASDSLAIDRASHDACYTRAIARYDADNLDGALQDMNRAIELMPLLADYYSFRADVLESLNRDEEARRDRDMAAALEVVPAQPAAQPAASPAETPAETPDASLDF